MRHLALRSLAKEFQLTLEATKKKIHALRSTYLQMRDRVSEHKNHEPTLSWYYEMEFLDPVITPRKPMELKKIRSRFPRKRAHEKIDLDTEDDVEEVPTQTMKMEELAYEEETANSEQEEVYIEYIEQGGREESCDMQEVDSGTKYISIPESEESPPAAPASSTSLDEFDIFGQSVAAQLKTMPLMHAIPLMGRIQGVISEFRMKSLQSALK